MNKFVLHAPSHTIMTSGKVREDIVSIANDLDYEKLEFDEIESALPRVGQKDIFLFPYPSARGTEREDLERIRMIKAAGGDVVLITLNIDYLRYKDADKEAIIESLNESSVIISLSRRLSRQLRLDGVSPDRPIVELLLHDYLVNQNVRPPMFEKTVIFAGSPYKTPYIQDWPNLTPVDIFAREKEATALDINANNVNYIGYVHPDMIPRMLNYGFGLAFDAASKAGDFATYQTMNLSHKVSMFLAAGVPLIINAKAASAETIEAANAGILINDIEEIDSALESINEHDYAEMVAGARRLGELVRTGFFYRQVILSAEKYL